MFRAESGLRFRNTVRVATLLAAVSCLPSGRAQTAWRHVGGFTVNEGLAGPAGGPIRSVLFADGGTRLLALTGNGSIFETLDFEHWRLNSAPLPTVIAPPGSRLYAARPDNLYASDDSGRTWLNLTGFNNRSVIGDAFSAVAVAPVDSKQIAAANRYGVWRSLDGGASWHSLNEDLPSLQVRKLLGRRKALLEGGGVIALASGAWVQSGEIDPETELRRLAASRSRLRVTAAAQAGSLLYAGSTDGMAGVSRDGGATWSISSIAGGVAVERIWIDSEKPEAALLAAGPRLFRTVNGGLFWDEVGATLPLAPIHGIAADRAAGVVYVATDRGLFSGSVSLEDAGPVAPNWALASRDLPVSAVWDARLNADHTLTVAIDGYGVYETAAPHKVRGLRLVNSADLSERPAAPGSLISVPGAKVMQARAGRFDYPIIAASEESSQIQVPFETEPGAFRLTLGGDFGQWSAPLTVKDAAPSIFVDSDGAPLILDSDTGLVLDSKVAVRAGATVQVLATGLGKVTPEWSSGMAAPLDSPPSVRGTVTAFLDGSPVQVTRATLAPGYIGYYIVELKIPRLINRGASELRLVMNAEESNRVRLYLEPDLN